MASDKAVVRCAALRWVGWIWGIERKGVECVRPTRIGKGHSLYCTYILLKRVMSDGEGAQYCTYTVDKGDEVM